jgi:hypothetical protein
MPQFDLITFFTQIFWFNIIFFGFYFLILQAFLPKVAAVLKSRKKKLLSSSTLVSNLKREHLLSVGLRNTLLQDFAEKTKGKLSLKSSLSSTWLKAYLIKSFKQQLEISQSAYFESYQNTLINKI